MFNSATPIFQHNEMIPMPNGSISHHSAEINIGTHTAENTTRLKSSLTCRECLTAESLVINFSMKLIMSSHRTISARGVPQGSIQGLLLMSLLSMRTFPLKPTSNPVLSGCLWVSVNAPQLVNHTAARRWLRAVHETIFICSGLNYTWLVVFMRWQLPAGCEDHSFLICLQILFIQTTLFTS